MTLRSLSFFHFEFWLFFKTPKKLRFTTLSLKILNTSELHWALKPLQPLSLLLFKLTTKIYICCFVNTQNARCKDFFKTAAKKENIFPGEASFSQHLLTITEFIDSWISACSWYTYLWPLSMILLSLEYRSLFPSNPKSHLVFFYKDVN